MLEHLLGVNWVRIWLQASCKSWERLHSFSYEQDFRILRCDGFAAIKNTFTGQFRFLFVEMDRGTNDFDKVKRYGKLFKEGGYSSSWWVNLTERFPPVLIATTTPRRSEQIRERVDAENANELEFKVLLLEDIKSELHDT